MTTLQLPPISIPTGCEAEAVKFLRGVKDLLRFTSEPAVVSNSGVRTFTASMEHAIEQGAIQVEKAIESEKSIKLAA